MSQYANLKAAIAANVYENHNNEVTANMVKAAMNAMVDSLGAGYQYMGIAVLTPTPTNPGTPDQRVFYIAAQPGTYTNFSGLVVNDGEVAILKWDTAWHKEATGAATAAQVTELGQKVAFNQNDESLSLVGTLDLPMSITRAGSTYELSPFRLVAGKNYGLRIITTPAQSTECVLREQAGGGGWTTLIEVPMDGTIVNYTPDHDIEQSFLYARQSVTPGDITLQVIAPTSFDSRIDELELASVFTSESVSSELLESGNIRVTNGSLDYYTASTRTRLREGSLLYIPANCYVKLPTSVANRFFLLSRLSDGTWTNTGWLTTGSFKTSINGYYTIVFDATYSEEKAEEIANNLIIRKDIYEEISNVYPSGSVKYYGPRVCLDKSNEAYLCNIEKIYEEAYGDSVNPLIETQSSAVYNDKMFVFLATETTPAAGILCKIFDLQTKAFIATIPDTIHTNSHLNGACFTGVFYDIDDPFPLLLLSSGSSSYSSWCKVVRVVTTEVNNEVVYSFALIKTIYFDTGTLTHTRFGTTCIDEINDCLWFYGYKDYTDAHGVNVRECWFHKFPIPDLTDGADTTLTKADVQRVLKYPYRVAGQDMDIYNGKAYMSGLDQHRFPGFPTTSPSRNVTVVNLETGEIENIIPSIDNAETEGISVYNNALYVTSRRDGTDHASTDIIFHITKWIFG